MAHIARVGRVGTSAVARAATLGGEVATGPRALGGGGGIIAGIIYNNMDSKRDRVGARG